MTTETGRAWAAALAVATVAGSLASACMLPFVALAVVAAATLPRAGALATVGIIWAANQAIGFGLLGYPGTTYAIAWGLAIGVAALAATVVARAIVDAFAVPRLVAALVAGFAAYELLLFGFAHVMGGLGTFTPAIVGQIAANEALWFVVLVGVRFALTRALPRWFGTPATLRFA